MTFNSQSIIHDIRRELDKLINVASGEQAQTATADHIERTLFRGMLRLGAKLLLLFFVTRAQRCSREPIRMKDGQELPYHSEKKRDYLSIFPFANIMTS
jgi:hypothetical protein